MEIYSIWTSPDEKKWFEKMEKLIVESNIFKNIDEKHIEYAVNEIYSELSYCLWQEEREVEYDEEDVEIVKDVKYNIFNAISDKCQNNELKMLAFLCDKNDEEKFEMFENSSDEGILTAMTWISNQFTL